MAKGKGEVKGWITRNGVHIPIYGNYSVRGGVEPKAKGSKFKGKKKPDKYTNLRTGKRDHVQGKTQAELNKALKEQGLELDGAYQRAANEEKVYMYDKDGNVYSGIFNKYSDGGREIVNIERDKLDGESNVRNLDPDRDEHIKNGESKGAKREEAIKKQENERFKTAKELKAEGKWDTSEKDKYADRDFSSDLANAHKAGYSEQTEEGPTPNKAVNDYLAGKGGKRDEFNANLNKIMDSDDYEDRLAKVDKMANEGIPYAEAVKRVANDNIKNTQASSTPDLSKMSYAEAGAYVAEHKKDFGLSEGADAYQAAYEMKKGTWEGKAPGQASSSKYDKVSPGGASEWENFTDAQVMDYAKDDHYRQSAATEMQKRGLGITDQRAYYDSKQASSTPDFSKMSYSEAGKHVAANKAQYGLKDSDDAYMAAAQMKDGTWKGQQTAQENRAAAKTKNRKTMADSPESSTSKSSSVISKANARVDNYDTSLEGRISTIKSMTVSGLRQAYSQATGSEKAMIASQLRLKGYTLVGGKWVKGK